VGFVMCVFVRPTYTIQNILYIIYYTTYTSGSGFEIVGSQLEVPLSLLLEKQYMVSFK
jgi:hypothetical protein